MANGVVLYVTKPRTHSRGDTGLFLGAPTLEGRGGYIFVHCVGSFSDGERGYLQVPPNKKTQLPTQPVIQWPP